MASIFAWLRSENHEQANEELKDKQTQGHIEKQGSVAWVAGWRHSPEAQNMHCLQLNSETGFMLYS